MVGIVIYKRLFFMFIVVRLDNVLEWLMLCFFLYLNRFVVFIWWCWFVLKKVILFFFRSFMRCGCDIFNKLVVCWVVNFVFIGIIWNFLLFDINCNNFIKDVVRVGVKVIGLICFLLSVRFSLMVLLLFICEVRIWWRLLVFLILIWFGKCFVNVFFVCIIMGFFFFMWWDFVFYL